MLRGNSEKEAQTKIEVDYSNGHYNDKVTIFNPAGAESLPEDISVVFITEKGYPINSPKHAFLLEKISNGQYYIHSSWSQPRASELHEWEAYRNERMTKGEEYMNHDEYEVHDIIRMPTTQGPFEERTLREYFSNLKPHLRTLFGLTSREMKCVHDKYQNIDIQIFRGT